MKIGIKISEATLEEMIVYEAICKPLIEEILEEFLNVANPNKVEEEDE